MCLAASLALFLAGAVSALEIPTGGSTLFSLDTTAPDPQLTLAGSTVLGWGPFSLMKTNNLPPTLGTFNGVSAVRFYDTGDSHLRSDADAPGTVTGGNAWTIEAWAYTTNLWSLSVLLSWGNDLAANGHSATLSYGNDAAQGAVRHTGDNAFNLGYIGLSGNAPAQGEWHHLAVTYSGAADGQRREHLYVDGVLIAGQNNLALNVEAGTRFHLGTLFRPSAGTFIQRYSGTLARVRLHSGVLSASQVAANYNEESAHFGRAALDPSLNAFEGTGAWTDTTRWSQSTLPAPDQRILVAGDAQAASAQSIPADLHVVGTLSPSGSAATFQTGGTAYVGYGTGALRISDGAEFISNTNGTPALAVGYRRDGFLSVTNASLTVTNGLFAVGYATQGIGTAELVNATTRLQNTLIGTGSTSASGFIRLTNGTLNASGTFYIGEAATGRMAVEDADVTIANTFVAGRNTNGKGSYEQRGGTLTFRSTAVVGSGGNASGTMTLTDMLMVCTNSSANNAFTVANANGMLTATNCTFIFNDFNVANPVGGAKGTAVVVRASVSARDITVANNSNTLGRLSFEECIVTSRSVYVGRKPTANGQLDVSQTRAISTSAWTIGEETGSLGIAMISDSDISTPAFDIGKNIGAIGSATLVSGLIDVPTRFYVGSSGNGTFSNLAGIVRTKELHVPSASNSANGYLYNGPGAHIESPDVIQVGRYGVGRFDCYGSVNAYGERGLFIGNLAGSTGVFNLYPGGSVSIFQRIVLGYTAGDGTFNQYGGNLLVSNTTCIAGNASGSISSGAFNLYGGMFTASNAVIVGMGGTGVLHVAGGTLLIPTNSLTLGNGPNAHGQCFLEGGQLSPYFIRRVNGIGEFYFDGGTLMPPVNYATYMTGLTKAEVRAGGAVIDTDGKDITISQPIAHDSRVGVPAKDGGLTKRGAGTLTMTGTLGFTGDLGADGGTLNLSAATYALPAGSGLWGSGTLVPPASGFSMPADSWIAPGNTNGLGTLTVNGNVTVNGEIRIRISPDGSTCGTLATTGNTLFPPGSTVVIENPEDMVKGANYTFLTAPSISGAPTVANLPSLWTFQLSGNRLRAVFFSGTLFTIQ